MQRLVNHYEEIAHSEIKCAADRWGLSVYPKVRVADVISLDRVDARGDLRRFGLQSHFDFTICRNRWDPIYAVEFDGRYHSSTEQAGRDAKKDELCRRGNFPILRINSRYLSKEFGSLTLLAWILDVYEMQEAFAEAQSHGSIPSDEPFDPLLLISSRDGGGRFPYWLSATRRVQLKRLHAQGRIAEPTTSGFLGYDSEQVMRGIEYIRVTKTEGVFVQSAMRPQQFPIVLDDLFEEILYIQLAEVVFKWMRGDVRAVPISAIRARHDAMRMTLKMSRAHYFRTSGEEGG